VAERSARASGHLLVSAPAGFGRQHVAPLLPSFLAEHRDVTINLNLNDRVVDVVGEGVDVAIRIASLSDSKPGGRQAGRQPRVVVGAPAYLKRHGTPRRWPTWRGTTAWRSAAKAASAAGPFATTASR
jgi:DNA-binding transcriptional LysR family regulator